MILGAVLAGGQASRFGGDKALALLNGQPLIAHALAAIAPFTDAQVICGRESSFAPGVPDAPAAGLGPLGGICGALLHARERDFEAVLTIACDTPALPDGMAAALLASGCAYAAEAPTVGMWPAALAEGLLRHLEAGGDRSIWRWARGVGAAPVLPGVEVRGANTVAELAALRGDG